MPGMTGGQGPAGPALAEAFKAALLNQGVLALLIFAILAIAWVACRELLPARARIRLSARQQARTAEPAGRRIIRIGFGVLWVFDAILQGQPAMPGGLTSQVIAPAAGSSPGWVRELVHWGSVGWSYHPVQDAAAAVWIQLGVGVWLLASARGRWSRAAGLACAAWGLVVWIFGEALGGVLSPGLSLLTGAPGAAALYVAGGVLVALPERHWASAGLGRSWLRLIGAGLAGAALLQAWPGRGYWQGVVRGKPGPLTDMVQSMAGTRQPAFLARLVSGFGNLVAAHGFAVNLLAVVVLAAGAAALLSGRAAVRGPAVIALAVFCLADWVLVQDLGFFGGLGTDPNSMVPLVLLLAGGYAAAEPVRARSAGRRALTEAGPAEPVAADAGPAEPGPEPLERVGRRLRVAAGTASASAVVALWAAAVMLLGAAPMVAAAVQRTGTPVRATASHHQGTGLARASGPIAVPPSTSVLSPGGASFAIVATGGSAAAPGSRWQLFRRPAHGSGWQLATPPGPPLPGDLASVPGALAAGPAGRFLALTATGQVLLRATGARAGWQLLSTQRTLAATAAGRACGLTGLTAVAFGPRGTPLLAGTCAHARAAGIFALDSSGTWRLTGPALPAADSVLSLAGTGPTTTALIRTAAGHFFVAWQAASGRWTTSAALVAGPAPVLSVSVWPGGAVGVLFSGGRAAVVTGTGGRWQPLSGLPDDTVTLAAEASGPVEALSASGGTFRAWDLSAGGWRLAQQLRVPIPAGFSG
jgi:hypothetical protein